MNDLCVLLPSYPLLVMKVLAIGTLTWLVGWSLFPGMTQYREPFKTFLVRQTLGASFLLLLAVNFVFWGLPGKYASYLAILMVLARGLWAWLRQRDQFTPTLHEQILPLWPLFLTVLGYIAVLTFPFLWKWTSGFYAISGGDHSTYFPLSEFFIHHSLRDTVNFGSAATLPPAPNWAPLRMLSLLQERRLDTFANQVIATPYLSLLPGSLEESYMATVVFYTTLMCANTAVLVSSLVTTSRRVFLMTLWIILGSNLLIWSMAKHSTPALFAFSAILIVLTLCIDGVEARRLKWILISVIYAALMLIYPHFFALCVAPVGFFIIVQIWRRQLRFQDLWPLAWQLLLGLALCLLLVNLILTDYLLHLLKTSSSYRGADIGYPWWGLLVALSGAIDFDALTGFAGKHVRRLPMLLMCAMLVPGVLFYLLDRKSPKRWVLIFFIGPLIGMSLYYYLIRGGSQYQAIRLTELAHLGFLGLVGLGYARVQSIMDDSSAARYRHVLRWFSRMLLVFPLVFFIISLPGKKHLYNRIIGKNPSVLADFKNAGALDLARHLPLVHQDRRRTHPDNVFYWFDWGPARLAGSMILLRQVPYFEAFNYTYSITFRNLLSFAQVDTLAPRMLSNALFVVPRDENFRGILDTSGFQRLAFVYENKDFQVIDPLRGAGCLPVGEAWNAPTPEPLNPFASHMLYLMGRERGNSGLVFWTDRECQVDVRIYTWGNEDKHAMAWQVAMDRPVLATPLPAKKIPPDFIALRLGLVKGITTLRLAGTSSLPPKTLEGLTDFKPCPWTPIFKIQVALAP